MTTVACHKVATMTMAANSDSPNTHVRTRPYARTLYRSLEETRTKIHRRFHPLYPHYKYHISKQHTDTHQRARSHAHICLKGKWL